MITYTPSAVTATPFHEAITTDETSNCPVIWTRQVVTSEVRTIDIPAGPPIAYGTTANQELVYTDSYLVCSPGTCPPTATGTAPWVWGLTGDYPTPSTLTQRVSGSVSGSTVTFDDPSQFKFQINPFVGPGENGSFVPTTGSCAMSLFSLQGTSLNFSVTCDWTSQGQTVQRCLNVPGTPSGSDVYTYSLTKQ
jgi:hypothetical protein